MGKSIKLSNEKRDSIKDDLVKEYKKKIKFEEERTKLVDLITKWFDENLDPDIKKLYDRILKDYSFVFQITHLDDIVDWHDKVVTVKKVNNISSITVENKSVKQVI